MVNSLPDVDRGCVAVVLAAGEGTRMRSARPKVLHEVAGRSMLGHCLAAVAAAGIDAVALVVGPQRDDVAAQAPAARRFTQTERRGTAHAVLAAEPALDGRDVLVAFADTPLLRGATLRALLTRLRETGAAVAVAGFRAADPSGYGRLIRDDDGGLIAIREDKDASDAERELNLCNGGLMALDGRVARELLDAVDANNSKGEYYLTDVVGIARARGMAATWTVIDEDEVLGVNDRIQLAQAERIMQQRLREAALREGATLADPGSVTLAFDTVLDRDVLVEPHVVFAPGVRVGEGTRIRAFSHLEGVTIGAGATIGPFARLRPGTVLAEGVHVGNFVEIKASTLARGVKANHLTYLGDADIGSGTNIGAGTITCNYDGFTKARTTIGANVFVGSDTSLVAPVSIGDGAYIGTGAVITQDVSADALAIARTRQVEKPGWAPRFRRSRSDAGVPPRTPRPETP